MPVSAVRLSHGRAGNRDPGRAERKPGDSATRSDGRLSPRAARLEYGKTAIDRRNARPGACPSNTRSQRDHAGAQRCSIADAGQNGGRSRKTSAPRGLRGPHCGFEDVQRQAQWKRCRSLCRGLRMKPMNTMAKALAFLIWFSGPAVCSAKPTSVREFSERCAASYASAFEVPLELVEAVIQVESGWNP